MLHRYSSRRASLYEEFLKKRLAGARRYHRIAGYFQSSLLEIASEELAAIPEVRILCNTEVNPDDVKTVRMAAGGRRKELEESLLRLVWNAGHLTRLVDVHGSAAQERLSVLHSLIMVSGQGGRIFEIRIVPNAEFGFVHGKGGIIEGDWGRTSFIGSANDSARHQALAEQLLGCNFSCVIWDEAHKIRRGNLAPATVYNPPDKKLLYQFAEQLAGRTRTLLLATATPVQLHPMELWDLLSIVSINNPQVLGSSNSLWRRADSPEIFDIVAGRKDVDRLYDKWQYWRNPLPTPLDAKTEVFDWVRHDLSLELTDDQATNVDFDRIDPSRTVDLEFLALREVNPFTQRVIKRSRDRLEEEGKLVKIEMVPFGDGQPILCSHSMEQAFELAADFARALNQRVKASGFIKTLLQRRVGSSLAAGLITTCKMLAGRMLEQDEDPNEDADSLYPLTAAEQRLLQRLKEHLQRHLEREDDPKFDRVRQVLQQEFEGRTWLARGVLIFSQFYDSALALCEYLSQHTAEAIGLYTNTSASKLFEGGKVLNIDRGLLKEKVTQGRLKLLVGTDAASTGLNLQRLGCLINLDIPWNPTVLEQRKGRVQRGAIAKRIPFYNMRYDKGVEQKLFETLSGRIQEITAIFGTIPDFIVDQWVQDMLEDREWDENTVLTVIANQQENPFTLKETTESLDADWDSTAEVLNQIDAFRELLGAW